MPRQAAIGEVYGYKLRTNGRLGYVQVVAVTPVGEIGRVLPGRYEQEPDIGRLVAASHEYMVCTLFKVDEKAGAARRIGVWPVPEHGRWDGYGLTPFPDSSGTPSWWILRDWSAGGKRLDTLPRSMRQRYPIIQIGVYMDVPDMLAASSRGWLEGTELCAWRDANGLSGGVRASRNDDDQPYVRHFVVFPNPAHVARAATELAGSGFAVRETVEDPDLLDGTMLVLEPDLAAGVSPVIDTQCDVVKDIVEAPGGQYDGWEASASPPG